MHAKLGERPIPDSWALTLHQLEDSRVQDECLIILITHYFQAFAAATPGLCAGVACCATLGRQVRWRAQVTLRAPADILGSVSLRGEEDGWFGRTASGALAAVLDAGGWPAPLPDEFFFQVRLEALLCLVRVHRRNSTSQPRFEKADETL